MNTLALYILKIYTYSCTCTLMITLCTLTSISPSQCQSLSLVCIGVARKMQIKMKRRDGKKIPVRTELRARMPHTILSLPFSKIPTTSRTSLGPLENYRQLQVSPRTPETIRQKRGRGRLLLLLRVRIKRASAGSYRLLVLSLSCSIQRVFGCSTNTRPKMHFPYPSSRLHAHRTCHGTCCRTQ